MNVNRYVTASSLLRFMCRSCILYPLFMAPALAQIEKVNTVLTRFQVMLIGLGVTIITIALLWVAYKMALQHSKWAEVANVAYGGILAGAAPGIAAWLIN